MSTPVAALIVRPDGTAEIRDVEPDLDALRDLIGGGWLEAVAVGGHEDGQRGAWHAYADEEGTMKGLPVNMAATEFLGALGRPWQAPPLVGPVVFLGSKSNGAEADVPPKVVGAAVRTWGLDPA